MDKRSKNWIFGSNFHKDSENLHFLYKSLVKNVKEHRDWMVQEVESTAQGRKNSVCLISSPSELTPGFEGGVIFANNFEPFPKTNSKVIRLGFFFPDEISYPQDIPLLPLRPDASLLDNLTPSHGNYSILLLREPEENECNRNILNALESLPESSSILLEKKNETEVKKALTRICTASLVLSSVECPLVNQLFAEVVRIHGGRFHLFARQSHSPLRFLGNHNQITTLGGERMSIRAFISSILKDLDKHDRNQTDITKTLLPFGTELIEEIEEAFSSNLPLYFPVPKKSFNSLISHPIEFQFSRDNNYPHASSTLHYLKYLKSLPGREETLRESASIAFFFQRIGDGLLSNDSDNFKIFGIVDLIRELPDFINHLRDYLSILSPGSNTQKGIRLISLFRSAYSNYNFPYETEKLLDEFFTQSIEWLRQAKSSEATIALGQILSLKEDQKAFEHIFHSIIKTDKKFARDFLSRSLLYGIYAKRGSEIAPNGNTQIPQWLLDCSAMIEEVVEDVQVSHDLNYLRVKGDIWRSEESRIKWILEDSDKRGGMYESYLIELMEDSILAGLSKTIDLLASKLQEKSKKMNAVTRVNFYSLLALHNDNCHMAEIHFDEMNEKIPLCKRNLPDRTACALSITAKLAKDENLSKIYHDFGLKNGFRKTKRLDRLLRIADQVKSQSICDWAEKVINATGPRLQ